MIPRGKRHAARAVVAMLPIWSIAGCPNAPAPDDGGKVSFAAQVQPILTASCAGCHQPGGFADLAGSDLDLRTGVAYDELLSGDAEHTLVMPGDPSASFLFEKISSDNPSEGSRMPLNGSLSDTDIETIRAWIAEGASDN
ncbi:MAG: hypothetical protein D6744_03545 [Planctomycetota bacterium]|nr:MAG: hypothetical protein D6744_03545 [Planctomycetota bacterium]